MSSSAYYYTTNFKTVHGKLDKLINVPDNNNIMLVEEVFNMSRLIYPGSRKVEGPWLLDKTNLQTFEKMVNAIVTEFCNDSGEEYRAEYTITFSDGKNIVEHSLLNFDNNHDIRNALPCKLLVKIYSGNSSIYCTELTFELNHRMFQSFDYNIRNITKEESKLIIINKIEDWIEENQPSKFMKWWNKYYSIFPFFFFGGFFSILFTYTSRTSASQLYQNSLRPQIQIILEHGVDESNYMNALELLLTKEYSYVPSSFEVTSNNPKIYLLLILICLVISIIGFLCPKANIAIGAGRKKVKFGKSYERFITISIPTLILLPLLEKFISSFF